MSAAVSVYGGGRRGREPDLEEAGRVANANPVVCWGACGKLNPHYPTLLGSRMATSRISGGLWVFSFRIARH